MMTFEEFFKKKKIDLGKLKIADATLFAEFENHYAQMGEKSFDYTKKYWFNELRRKYHTPDEPKVEKIKTDNQLAEQTITESLGSVPNAEPTKGYKPKFRVLPVAGTAPKPNAEEPMIVTDNPIEAPKAEDVTTPKLGFKPKFKTAATPAAKQVEEQPALNNENTETTKAEEPAAPKLSFKPKFRAATPPATKPAEEQPTVNNEETKAEEVTAPKLGFKPKFKPATPPVVKPHEELPKINIEEPKAEEVTAPKLGFKPKFKATTPAKTNEVIAPETDQSPEAQEGDK